MSLKSQLEGRLRGIGYKDGDYINFDRLHKILKSLRHVYLINVDRGYSVLIGHERENSFPKDVKIITILENNHQIWSAGIGYIPSIEVALKS